MAKPPPAPRPQEIWNLQELSPQTHTQAPGLVFVFRRVSTAPPAAGTTRRSRPRAPALQAARYHRVAPTPQTGTLFCASPTAHTGASVSTLYPHSQIPPPRPKARPFPTPRLLPRPNFVQQLHVPLALFLLFRVRHYPLSFFSLTALNQSSPSSSSQAPEP